MRPILAALLLLALPAAAHAQSSSPQSSSGQSSSGQSSSGQSSPAEEAMMQTVTQEHDRHIALLERMVNQNSGTLNVAGVRAVGDMVRAELEPLGFQVRWIDMDETGRAGHLVAAHPGQGRNVLLIGHLDTVFEAESPFQSKSQKRMIESPLDGAVITPSVQRPSGPLADAATRMKFPP